MKRLEINIPYVEKINFDTNFIFLFLFLFMFFRLVLFFQFYF